MSDDEADPELLELLRKSLGISSGPPAAPETKVLESASFICDNSIDVALDMYGTQSAAESIWSQMQQRGYSRKSWSEHELHPSKEEMGDEDRLNFIFTMDLLNFSFWTERDGDSRFAVDYKDKRWTGYWALVAALRRALEEGIEITSPHFWHNGDMTIDTIRHVFRSATDDEMPLLQERFDVMIEAGEVLCMNFESCISSLVTSADHSAPGLANILAEHFPSFRDESRFEGRKVRFLKRAQIFVADLWAAFDGQDWGDFDDIDKITMFADYRIPQILHTLGSMSYSPPLDAHIRAKREIPPGSSWEIQLRGCSIWSVESIRRQIKRKHPDAELNAILIDFFLYDAMKELEKKAQESLTASKENADVREMIPHHRTRSIWY
ncbi:hypothetical protein NA57DRAFT_45468 [Rhizodiscina lignyota]|uniref:Queuosine 5'-phosphate N-glycosylase/hydrolase n=1 Tax=Rhizodiscina lignyota TaxID=1504668 RepID=A0A9P4M2P6_9PEZI|nr:hypothetical protein NA57DRAFT_45468 [Rhizodiscina lignyota]